MTCKFEVGDEVKCKPGFEPRDTTPNGGGTGYIAGKEFTIKEITRHDEGCVMWPTNGSCGVWDRALEMKKVTNWKRRLKG